MLSLGQLLVAVSIAEAFPDSKTKFKFCNGYFLRPSI